MNRTTIKDLREQLDKLSDRMKRTRLKAYRTQPRRRKAPQGEKGELAQAEIDLLDDAQSTVMDAVATLDELL